MARKTTGPRYFPSKGGYYVTVNGERICLAKGTERDPEVKAEAHRRYNELMATKPTSGAISVDAVLDGFLGHTLQNAKPSTFAVWRRVFERFCNDLGPMAARDLKPYHITDWLARMAEERKHPHNGRVLKWGPGMRRIAIAGLKAAFRWACDQELIAVNPAAKLKKPPARSRGGDELLTEETYQKIVEGASSAVKDILEVLYETGARPGEIYAIEAKHYRPEVRAFVLDEHKTQRLGKPRIIYLTPRAIEIVALLSEKHPVGPIFRTDKGLPWTLHHMADRWRVFRKKLGLRKGVTVYAMRHLFATQFILAGGSMAYLAQLQGNTVATIERHYAHLREYGEQLRMQLLAFRSGSAGDVSSQPVSGPALIAGRSRVVG